MTADYATEKDKKAWAVAQVKILLNTGRDEEGRPWSQASLARALGVSRGQVWHIDQSTPMAPKGPGEDTYEGLRRLLKLTAPGLFEEAVIAWRRRNPAPKVPASYEGPYPNLHSAAERFIQMGGEQRAIDYVESRIDKGQRDYDQLEWMRRLIEAATALRWGDRNPGEVARVEAARTAANVRDAEERSKAPRPSLKERSAAILAKRKPEDAPEPGRRTGLKAPRK